MKISEGNTNNYLVQGVFVFIPAAILCGIGLGGNLLFLFIGAPLLIVAVFLFMGVNGLELDLKARRYRKYGQFGPITTGVWTELPEVQSVRVQIHSENETRQGLIVGPGGRVGVSTKTMTYDVAVVQPDERQHVIYSFLTYKNAKKAMKALCEGLEVEGRDVVAEKLAENRERRRR